MAEEYFHEKADFTAQELVDHIYNKKIPEIYRIADEELTDKDLYRFLQVGYLGGLDGDLDKIASLKTLVNPLTCPEKYLPYLYACFGLPYFEDIGVYYNRKFLNNIGNFIKRRGTMGGYKYIIRALTGYESDIEYERITEGELARVLHITVNVPTLAEIDHIEIPLYTISRFLKEHTPYYIRSIDLKSKVTIHEEVTNIIANILAAGINLHYNLVPPETIKEIFYYGREPVIGISSYRPSYSFIDMQKPEDNRKNPHLGNRVVTGVSMRPSYSFIDMQKPEDNRKNPHLGNKVVNALWVYPSYSFVDMQKLDAGNNLYLADRVVITVGMNSSYSFIDMQKPSRNKNPHLGNRIVNTLWIYPSYSFTNIQKPEDNRKNPHLGSKTVLDVGMNSSYSFVDMQKPSRNKNPHLGNRAVIAVGMHPSYSFIDMQKPDAGSNLYFTNKAVITVEGRLSYSFVGMQKSSINN